MYNIEANNGIILLAKTRIAFTLIKAYCPRLTQHTVLFPWWIQLDIHYSIFYFLISNSSLKRELCDFVLSLGPAC